MTRPYQDVRVIDLARELGSYAGRLFADLGAEVIRVEPPGGRADRLAPPGMPEASGGIPFAFFNVNKKSVVVDTTGDSGRGILRDLIASADIVIYEADVDRSEMLPLILGTPGRRVVTIVSYFGLTGPYADYLGCDLVAQAVGGLAWLTGTPDQPPLRLAGEQSCFVTSLYAATVTALALWDGDRTGASHVIDVSAQECIAHSLQHAPQVYDLEHRIMRRGGEGTRDATENIFRCKDGFVFLAAPLQLTTTWASLVSWLTEAGGEGSARLQEPDWQNRALRLTMPMHAEFRKIFEAFIADKTRAELVAAALRRKVVLAPVNTMADTLIDPQLVFRQFFRSVPYPALGRDVVFPGAPYQLSEPVWSIDRVAPHLGEDDAAILQPAAAAGADR